jgi:hypothetical protein
LEIWEPKNHKVEKKVISRAAFGEGKKTCRSILGLRRRFLYWHFFGIHVGAGSRINIAMLKEINSKKW